AKVAHVRLHCHLVAAAFDSFHEPWPKRPLVAAKLAEVECGARPRSEVHSRTLREDKGSRAQQAHFRSVSRAIGFDRMSTRGVGRAKRTMRRVRPRRRTATAVERQKAAM